MSSLRQHRGPHGDAVSGPSAGLVKATITGPEGARAVTAERSGAAD
jgi:hypothetical protein